MTVSTEQKTIHLGEISTEELQLVKSAVDFVKWDSESRGGPIVKSLNGRRVWQVSNDDLRVTIFGSECRFEGTYMLSAQFIANCVPLIKLEATTLVSKNTDDVISSDWDLVAVLVNTPTVKLSKLDELGVAVFDAVNASGEDSEFRRRL